MTSERACIEKRNRRQHLHVDEFSKNMSSTEQMNGSRSVPATSGLGTACPTKPHILSGILQELEIQTKETFLRRSKRTGFVGPLGMQVCRTKHMPRCKSCSRGKLPQQGRSSSPSRQVHREISNTTSRNFPHLHLTNSISAYATIHACRAACKPSGSSRTTQVLS
jgi:hypothetical protein